MNVIKRNGSLYELDIDKLKISIINSANDINIILTHSDVKLLVNKVLSILNNIHKNDKLCTTSSYELRGIVYYVLVDQGFKNVADSYMDTAFRKHS